ncbi:MAG: phosphotransferase family protein [Pseudomonadales bacterium]
MEKQTSALRDWIEAHTGFTNANITRELSGGNSNVTQLISTDQQLIVLRTPPENTVSPKAHRGIEREWQVMNALHGHAKVPKPIAWCEAPEVIGRPFVLVSHIDGVSISDSLPANYAQTCTTLNALGEQLTDELATIHTLAWQDVGLANFGNPENFLQRQIERWLHIRTQSTVRELSAIGALGNWLLDNVPEHAPVSLIHGDYHLDNSLCAQDAPELIAVIDWEMATIGDPLTDLGLFLMFWGPRREDPPGFAHIQAVSRQHPVLSRRELAQRWSSATGYSLDALDFYMCFAFWRLAAIVEGAYVLYSQGKVDSDYARGLEYDVPALLREATAAAAGNW